MSRLWPVAEAAQADYEALRAAVLAGTAPFGPVAARFAAEGLWGLLAHPSAEAVYSSRLFGATRPPWTPYGDPRLEALADAFALVMAQGPERATGQWAAGGRL